MLPKYHLLYGAIFASVLLAVFPQITLVGAIVILASTFFIDGDHYLVYVFRKRDISLRNALNYYMEIRRKYGLTHKKGVKMPLLYFHIGEAVILAAILSLRYELFLWILIGFLFHIFLDFIDMKRLGVLGQRDYFALQRFMRKRFSKKDYYKYV
ncbi:hypothetical protein J4447_04115 [Candidatus Pacearchaeota archaeon]|nr:hypothetical protein [Candidatus Pacearchaeota archaeon]